MNESQESPEQTSSHPEQAEEVTLSARLRRTFGEDVDPGISLERGSSTRSGSSSTASIERLHKLRAHAPEQARYEVLGELARGGMGVVLKVWDEDLRRTLAMKVVLGRDEGAAQGEPDEVDPEKLSRFLEEAQITGQLDHPGIVPVHDLGLDDQKRVYFTMPLIKGKDLKEIIEDVHAGRSGWNRTRALPIFLKICDAMAFAHSKGVTHRDLKPSNVMVGRFGETYVMDWGLARVKGHTDHRDIRPRKEPTSAPPLTAVRTDRRDELQQDPESPVVTMDGDVVGTPAYMSPEQSQGRTEEVGPRSDVYSIGSMLYHMLAGQMPYVESGERVSPYTVLNAVRNGPPRPLHQIDRTLAPELVAICEKAMAREPDQRYADTREMGEDLRDFLEGRVVSAHETGRAARLRKWIERNRGLAAFMTISLLLAFGSLAFFLVQELKYSARLEGTNQELEQEKLQARRSEQEAIEAQTRAERSATEASTARNLAEQHKNEADRQVYQNLIGFADLSLRLDDIAGARRRLSEIDSVRKEWELDHLRLKSNTSLGFAEVRGLPPFLALVGHGGRWTFALAGRDVARIDLGRLGENPSSSKSTALAHDLFGVDGLMIYAAALHPDGDVLALGGSSPVGLSSQGKIQLWDTRSLTRRESIDAGGRRVLVLGYGEGGDELISVDDEGRVMITDCADNSELHSFSIQAPGPITSLALSRDGRHLAVGTDSGTLSLWNLDLEQEEHAVHLHDAAILAVVFDAGGERVLTASEDTTARLYHLDDQEVEATFVGHREAIMSAAIGPENRLVATASKDQTARIWDIRTGLEVNVLRGHEQDLSGVAFNPAGDTVVSIDTAGVLRVWDPVWSKAHLFLDGHEARVNAIAFSADGKRLYSASEDRSIATWDMDRAELVSRNLDSRDPVRAMEVSPDGRYLVAGGRDRVLRMWDLEDDPPGLIHGIEAHNRGISAVAVSPRGELVASATENLFDSIRLWDGRTGELLRELREDDRKVTDLCFSDRGDVLMSCSSSDELVRVWEVNSGRLLLECRGSEGSQGFECVDISPGRTLIAAAGRGGVIYLWNGLTGELHLRLSAHGAGRIRALDFSPLGNRLVSGGSDGVLRLWQPIHGGLLLELRVEELTRPLVSGRAGTICDVRSVSFSPDGSRIAAGTATSTSEARTQVLGHVWVWESQLGAGQSRSRREVSVLAQQAEVIFEDLRSNLGLVTEAIDTLQSDVNIEDALREAALRFAQVNRAAFDEMSLEAWIAARAPDAARAEYEEALRKAAEALDSDAGDRAYAVAMAAAQYRLGHYLDAFETLGAAADLRDSAGSAELPLPFCYQAFSALVHLHLGRTEEALSDVEATRATLEILRAAQGELPAWLTQLAAEVEELARQSGLSVGAPGD